MNKIEFKGKKILDIDEVNDAVEDVKTKVSSTDVKKIVVVTSYPQQEEQDVLYIKVES